jgi:DNA-binding transcriptional MocR family regulator
VAGPQPEPGLLIGAGARDLRRSLGLTTWAALEEVLLDATPRPSGSLRAPVSARVLAVRLGVSKDTAAAARRRLASAGLVRREEHRDTARGVFARSVYVIDAARLDDNDIRRHAAQPRRRTRPGAARVAASHGNGQPSLFDVATVEAR